MEEGLVTLSVPVRITSRKYVMKMIKMMMMHYNGDDDVVDVDDDDVNDAGTRQGGCFAANAVL